MVKSRGSYEDQEKSYLGGRISSSKDLSIFKTLARLGYDEAEEYALLEFFKWFVVSPEATIEEIMQKGIEFIGQARFMRLTTELTKLSMILGHAKKERDY